MSKVLRRLKKLRPKRYMNPFLCFRHEERQKFKNRQLLPEWRSAHNGLGKRWRALGAGKAKYNRHGNVPVFASFVKQSNPRQKILPEWIRWHRGLGDRWRKMDKKNKAKYQAASIKMKIPYEKAMQEYRNNKRLLLRSDRKTKPA